LPVLVGASRKGFIAELAPNARGARPTPEQRDAGSLAVLTVAVLKGAAAVRVHDVAAARQAVLVAEALRAREARTC
jgi:dihydropteroate synthase